MQKILTFTRNLLIKTIKIYEIQYAFNKSESFIQWSKPYNPWRSEIRNNEREMTWKMDKTNIYSTIIHTIGPRPLKNQSKYEWVDMCVVKTLIECPHVEDRHVKVIS